MIELTFSESAAGSLKMAKSMEEGQMMSGVIGIIGGTPEDLIRAQQPRPWKGMTLSGASGDVAPLSMYLELGDLSDMRPTPSSRKSILEKLFFDSPDVVESLSQENSRTLARLSKAKATMEQVRLWICPDDPAELCGLCWFCSWMADAGTPLSVILLPRYGEINGSFQPYRGSGGIPAEQLGALAQQERDLSAVEKAYFSDRWQQLMKENRPLRTVLNGRLISVDEDYYDFMLMRYAPEEEFVLAKLIGLVLNDLPGVSDRWLFLRVAALVEMGLMRQIEPAGFDHPYSGIFSLTEQGYKAKEQTP